MGGMRGVECGGRADEASLAGEGLGGAAWSAGGCSERERGRAGLALRM